MATPVSLTWKAYGTDGYYAQLLYNPVQGDLIIDLSEIQFNGSLLVPACVQVDPNLINTSPAYGTLINIAIDNVSFQIFGRTRKNFSLGDRYFKILSATSNSATITFYSWYKFGATIPDNSTTINGSMSFADNTKILTRNTRAFSAATNYNNPTRLPYSPGFYIDNPNTDGSGNPAYITRITFAGNLAAPVALGITDVIPALTASITLISQQPGFSKNLDSTITHNTCNARLTCLIFYETAPTYNFYDPFYYVYIPAGGSFTYRFKEPLKLDSGGNCLLVSPNTFLNDIGGDLTFSAEIIQQTAYSI